MHPIMQVDETQGFALKRASGRISLTLVGCPAGAKESYLDSNDYGAGFKKKSASVQTLILRAKSATSATSSVDMKST